jgi:tRNA pseudouridine38-40 synthase
MPAMGGQGERERRSEEPGQGEASAAMDAGPAGQDHVWRLHLTYEGTAFKGWARQPGQRTVEGVLQEALAMVLRREVRLSVAGRTDAGVHAGGQVASFLAGDLHPERLRHSLNALLPPDVAVNAVRLAPPDFVAREARGRTYRYRLWVDPVKPVLERAFVWNVRGDVDLERLIAAAALLPGHRDFAALTPSAHLYHTCVREVRRAAWSRGPDPELDFEITAGSFLHNMVRVAVGSMVDVAQGRMSLEGFAAGLEGGRRDRMGQTAPARGLMLIAVEY